MLALGTAASEGFCSYVTNLSTLGNKSQGTGVRYCFRMLQYQLLSGDAPHLTSTLSEPQMSEETTIHLIFVQIRIQLYSHLTFKYSYIMVFQINVK